MYDEAAMKRMRTLEGPDAAREALDRAFDLIHTDCEMTKGELKELCFWVGAAWGALHKKEDKTFEPSYDPLVYPKASKDSLRSLDEG
jgi:hypothetical protein